MKKLYIKTYGCQMNVYDSAKMADVMVPHGYSRVDNAEEADLVILNTCHIREKAEDKVYSDLGRVRQARLRRQARGEDMMIAVGGCVGQAEGKEIFRRAPFVDIVLGPQSYHRLPEMVKHARGKTKPEIIDLEFPAIPKFDFLPQTQGMPGVSAFVSVQEGCDKFCTFCVVPYTRGAEYSRPVADIVGEAKALVSKGVLEITLLGQNVNAYHGKGEGGGDCGLGQLMRTLSRIEGLRRIRYTTSHPRDMDDALITAHAEVESLMPFLHLPVQSGSDAVLKRMNRKHTAAEYISIVEKLRARRPDIALSSDFIVGFPGETEADFAATLGLVETVGYAQAYSFKYSPRPGTPAAEAGDQVPEPVKEERLQRLQELLNRQQLQFNRRMVGQVTEVLFDRTGKYKDQCIGKTPYMQSVHVQNAAGYIGRLMQVEITDAHANSLTGKIFNGSQAVKGLPLIAAV